MGKGEYGGGYSKADAARDTGVSTSEVSRAWHGARDDAAGEKEWGVPKDRHHGKDDTSTASSSGK